MRDLGLLLRTTAAPSVSLSSASPTSTPKSEKIIVGTDQIPQLKFTSSIEASKLGLNHEARW